MRRALVLALLVCACTRRTPQPPVILISIDTLRADHVSAYGYRGVATPNIDALAREGLRFDEAWSHCPLTLPSHLSILTGLLPPEHGVRDNAGYRFDAAKHETVASLLRAHGYATGAAVSAYVLRAATGANAGFDDYDDAIGMVDGAPLGALQRRGAATETIAEGWIDAHRGKPFFYFLHLYEPHTPYEPTYDADVAAADAIVGTFIGHLKQSGVYDDALIVLLSDHGEGLNDHGEAEHGVFVYREDLRVPLIVKLPRGLRRGKAGAVVSLRDVAPTILDAAGIANPASMHGTSLVSAPRPAAGDVYSESFYGRIHLGWSELRSMVRGNLHYIDAPRGELYEMANDPAESHNLAAGNRRAGAELRELARATAGPFAAPERVDPEEAKKLAALGYVSAGSDAAAGPLPDPKDVIGELEAVKRATSIDDLRRILTAHPRWSDVRDRLGAAYDAAGDHADAARVYEDGIALTPRLAGTFALSAGYALLAGGDAGGAAAHAQIALSAGEPGAHLLLGEIALARHDLAAAAREETAAEEFASQRAHALFLAARIAAAQRDYPRTLRILESVRRESARSGESLPQHFHYVAGDALGHMNRLGDAAGEFQREIAADSRFARAYEDLALIDFIVGRREDAHATLAKLAAQNPDPQTCLDVAKELDTFHDQTLAAEWRMRSRVGR